MAFQNMRDSRWLNPNMKMGLMPNAMLNDFDRISFNRLSSDNRYSISSSLHSNQPNSYLQSNFTSQASNNLPYYNNNNNNNSGLSNPSMNVARYVDGVYKSDLNINSRNDVHSRLGGREGSAGQSLGREALLNEAQSKLRAKNALSQQNVTQIGHFSGNETGLNELLNTNINRYTHEMTRKFNENPRNQKDWSESMKSIVPEANNLDFTKIINALDTLKQKGFGQKKIVSSGKSGMTEMLHSNVRREKESSDLKEMLESAYESDYRQSMEILEKEKKRLEEERKRRMELLSGLAEKKASKNKPSGFDTDPYWDKIKNKLSEEECKVLEILRKKAEGERSRNPSPLRRVRSPSPPRRGRSPSPLREVRSPSPVILKHVTNRHKSRSPKRIRRDSSPKYRSRSPISSRRRRASRSRSPEQTSRPMQYGSSISSRSIKRYHEEIEERYGASGSSLRLNPIPFVKSTPYQLIGALRLIRKTMVELGGSYTLQMEQNNVNVNVMNVPSSMLSHILQNSFELKLFAKPHGKVEHTQQKLNYIIDCAVENYLNYDVDVLAMAHNDEMDICDAKAYELAEYFRDTEVLITFNPKSIESGKGKDTKKSKRSKTIDRIGLPPLPPKPKEIESKKGMPLYPVEPQLQKEVMPQPFIQPPLDRSIHSRLGVKSTSVHSRLSKPDGPTSVHSRLGMKVIENKSCRPANAIPQSDDEIEVVDVVEGNEPQLKRFIRDRPPRRF